MAEGEEGTPLDGGVASDIRVIDGPDGPLVIKKALPKLKVQADWFSDPSRSLTEVAAIETFARLGGADVVPQIVWTKPEQNCFAMRLVDPRLRNWKSDLLAGRINLETARRVGEILGAFHAHSANDNEIAARFADLTFFRELRVEPFFEHVARQKPELATRILSTADALTRDRSALVHGDYSPKNILASGNEVVILDFEVAHWGNPRFDIAFCLAHLMLKSTFVPSARTQIDAAITAFIDGYRERGLPLIDQQLLHVVGCLLLARLFGKSPVDYLDRLDAELIEARAVRLLDVTSVTAPADFSIRLETY